MDLKVRSQMRNYVTQRLRMRGDLAPVDDPFAAPKQPDVALDGTSAAMDLRAPTIGLALSGRQEGMRQSLLGAYGGNKLSEGAVQEGLAFLARQLADTACHLQFEQRCKHLG